MGSDTTIGVTHEIADRLHARKARGESYNDVLERLLDETKGNREAQPAN